MKFYVIITTFAFGVLFAEQNEFFPLEKEEKAPTRFSVIPYVQSYIIFPGAGISFRAQKQSLGVQLDANMANSSLFGISYDYEISVSTLLYPLAREGEGWIYDRLYVSAGLGAHLNTSNFGLYRLQPCSPFFVGYEGEWINFSAGIDIVYWIPYSKYYERYMFFVTEVAPCVKLGICF